MAIDLEKLEYYRNLPVAYSAQEMYDWPDHSQTVRFSGTSQLWTWMGGDSGQFEYRGQNIPPEYYAIMVGDADDPGDDDGGGDGDTGGKPPPTFPSTGPVFTPLDPAGIAQRNYTPFYPQSYMPADPAYPSMGLLSQPAFGGTD